MEPLHCTKEHPLEPLYISRIHAAYYWHLQLWIWRRFRLKWLTLHSRYTFYWCMHSMGVKPMIQTYGIASIMLYCLRSSRVDQRALLSPRAKQRPPGAGPGVKLSDTRKNISQSVHEIITAQKSSFWQQTAPSMICKCFIQSCLYEHEEHER